MIFYVQLLRTHQLLSTKNITLSILLEIHTFFVCPSTIEARFYPDSEPEENTEKLLKGPKVTAFAAFKARHGLLGPYWFEEAGKTVSVNAACYRDVIKNLTPDDFYDNLSQTLSESRYEWPVQPTWGSTSYCP